MAKDVTPIRVRHALRRASGFAGKSRRLSSSWGTSTVLVACLAVAALNVVVQRESANVVEKQIQVLVQASRSVAPAILDNAGSCTVSLANSGELKPLLAYTDEAFAQAQASLIVEGSRGVQFLLPGPSRDPGKHPDWLPEADFAGLVVDSGQLEIRHVVTRQKNACKVTAIFSLPLGSELVKRLSFSSPYGSDACFPQTVSRPLAEPARTPNHRRQFRAWHVPTGCRCADRAQLGNRRTRGLDCIQCSTQLLKHLSGCGTLG
jgi:hypothetical protein